MKRVMLMGLLLTAGCAASKPVPTACYLSGPMGNPYGTPAAQEAIRQEQAQHQQFWKDNCVGRMGGSGGTISHSDVWPLRFRYVGPSYRGGLGGLEPY